MVLPHFYERVDESPQKEKNFGTFGIFLAFFVTGIRPFKVKFSVQTLLQCISKAQFINSANVLLLTAVYGQHCSKSEKFEQVACGYVYNRPG